MCDMKTGPHRSGMTYGHLCMWTRSTMEHRFDSCLDPQVRPSPASKARGLYTSLDSLVSRAQASSTACDLGSRSDVCAKEARVGDRKGAT